MWLRSRHVSSTVASCAGDSGSPSTVNSGCAPRLNNMFAMQKWHDSCRNNNNNAHIHAHYTLQGFLRFNLWYGVNIHTDKACCFAAAFGFLLQAPKFLPCPRTPRLGAEPKAARVSCCFCGRRALHCHTAMTPCIARFCCNPHLWIVAGPSR